MCGISGIISERFEILSLTERATRMALAQHSRGPDDSGVWHASNAGVALSHRRLSIVDLSALGSQPMLSRTERYCMVFNGEVYNFLDLRNQLLKLGATFRGGSDTEIMLAAFEAWGIEQSFSRFNGMFACAIWDNSERCLWLVRDRVGVKPLYYAWTEFGFLFASELKALCAVPEYRPTVNKTAVADYLCYSNVPAPYSIYQNTFKLVSAGMLQLNYADLLHKPTAFCPSKTPKRYWQIEDVVKTQAPMRTAELTKDYWQAKVNELDTLLRDAVKLRMLADVPLGAFLSGGIDSSIVVALMQTQSSQAVRTFSIGFEETSFNEAPYAKAVAQHLGTEHTELYVNSAEALECVPKLCEIYDEPFADSSQIPTYLLSKLTRKYVTVSLSGDGGDELFAGYARYALAARSWSALQHLPESLRGAIARIIHSIQPSKYESRLTNLSSFLPKQFQLARPGDKLEKFAKLCSAKNFEQLYLLTVGFWDCAQLINVQPSSSHLIDRRYTDAGLESIEERLSLLDFLHYLPDDIMAKVDRASMAASLEAREPLLDYRLVEFCWSLPLAAKISAGVQKRILRCVLEKYVPPNLTDRPKMGFGVPLATWLRGPLRDWAESLLSKEKIERDGLLRAEPILTAWRDLIQDKGSNHYLIWNILMLQAWRDRWMRT